MDKKLAIGNQDYAFLRENDCFYVDKTDFIRQWWESKDYTTLITRPRRFGKTLNMSMLDYFFSNKHEGRGDLFEGLSIWEEEEYRQLQGTWPVIFLSFANIKENTFAGTKRRLYQILINLYNDYEYLMKEKLLDGADAEFYDSVKAGMDEQTATLALHMMCRFLNDYYGKRVIILIDEYDTPMQEAWMSGYWEEMTSFMRSFLNCTFKTNPYMERGLMTGITRVTKESVFSDLNHMKVVTTTTKKYETCFGFTQEEVIKALKAFGLEAESEKVRFWYDGFTFGKVTDVYNPWSIICFLENREYDTYWSNTSGNGLVDKLIREGQKELKLDFEELIKGNILSCSIEEHTVFQELAWDDNAVWSLLVSAGYLKITSYNKYGNGEPGIMPCYRLAITNYETLLMFKRMVLKWFAPAKKEYSTFIQSLIQGDLEYMNILMSDICLKVFSYFDIGRDTGKSEPERFYHGFVLGLLVELEDRYILTSNRESGYGRYDVCLKPKDINDPAFILEFKVRNPKKEEDLEASVASALYQIEEKKYESSLISEGIPRENIRKYGFAFDGKEVLIGE